MENSLLPLDAVSRALEPVDGFWEHWGFSPWSRGNLAGVCRDQRFVKDGFLGKIAEYRAWDCIVWEAGSEEERDELWKRAAPMPEVMTQRFVFLVDDPWPERRIRSFSFGFKGFVEFYAYRPTFEGGRSHKGAKDLTGLVDMALRFSLTGKAEGDGLRGSGSR